MSGPGYFLLKFGKVKGVTEDHYFFQNIGEMDKLVWSNEQVNFSTGGGAGKRNIGKLSHYTTYNPERPHQDPELPEPATLALIGLGLFSIGTIRRRRQ